jgi:anti-sigma factor RsiW
VTTVHADSDLSAFLDGELPPADRARVDAHLEGCERCRARLGELRATASLIASLPSPRPSRSLVPRVVERYNWVRPLRSFSTFATGAFLMVFLVTAVGRSGSGLGGGPEVPFGRTATGAGAPAAATAAPESAALQTARSIPAPAAVPAAAPQATAMADAAQRTGTAPPAAAAGSPKSAAAEDAREQRREPPPLTDPLIWLGFAVIAAVTAIFAHWRMRTA